MSRPVPFTRSGLKRAILAAREAGLYVVGIRPDGTLITANEPAKLPLALDAPPTQDDDEARWRNLEV